jgi:3-hydroxyisobutyrate dehydrogenase-like beta-hydroxyacid dehydrogenase
MMRITFLGLGAMGSRIAAQLLDAGFDLTVWNRNPAKASALQQKHAKVAPTPHAAAAGADVVFAMVRDDAASRAVWLAPHSGAMAAMHPGAIVIESSTITLTQTHALAGAAADLGLGFLDAPVAGSRPQAEARQLIYLVGGDATTLSRAEPALKSVSSAIYHAGHAGAGMAMKLAVNALFGIQVAAIAELLGALEKQGIDAGKAAEILGATPVASTALKGAMMSMSAGTHAPLFPVELVAKDLDYAAVSASTADAKVPLTGAAGAVFGAANALGFGGDHLTVVRKLY